MAAQAFMRCAPRIIVTVRARRDGAGLGLFGSGWRAGGGGVPRLRQGRSGEVKAGPSHDTRCFGARREGRKRRGLHGWASRWSWLVLRGGAGADGRNHALAHGVIFLAGDLPGVAHGADRFHDRALIGRGVVLGEKLSPKEHHQQKADQRERDEGDDEDNDRLRRRALVGLGEKPKQGTSGRQELHVTDSPKKSPRGSEQSARAPLGFRRVLRRAWRAWRARRAVLWCR